MVRVPCVCVSDGFVLEGTPKTCPGQRPLQLPPWQVAAQHPLHTSGDAELICLQDISLQDGLEIYLHIFACVFRIC